MNSTTRLFLRCCVSSHVPTSWYRLNAGATAHDPHMVPRYPGKLTPRDFHPIFKGTSWTPNLEFWVPNLDFWVPNLDFWVPNLDFWVPNLDFWVPNLDFWVPNLDFPGCIHKNGRTVKAIFLTKEDFAKRMGGRSSVEERNDHVELWSYVHLWFWDIFSPIDLFWTYPHHQDDYIFSRASLQTCFCHLNPGVLGG